MNQSMTDRTRLAERLEQQSHDLFNGQTAFLLREAAEWLTRDEVLESEVQHWRSHAEEVGAVDGTALVLNWRDLKAKVTALEHEVESQRITIDGLAQERDEAIREKHEHIKAFDRERAIEHWRQKSVQLESALAEARAVLRRCVVVLDSLPWTDDNLLAESRAALGEGEGA